ncbi:hypothetical protein TruAng_011224 [Truncatella angustata]|nr:hypothetical protein TruAng_011224 [Truncatella angustata]
MSNQLQTSPRHMDGSTIETPSRGMDVSLFQRSQDLAGIDTGSNLLSGPFTTDQALLSTYGHQVSADPLQQWYTRNDGPWHPKGIAAPGSQIGQTQVSNGYVFSGHYRESISPSECDTAPPGPMPSDSGYGSHRPKHSIATTSICYDDSLDTQENTSIVGNFAFTMDPNQWVQPQGQRPASAMQRFTNSEGKELICETCRCTRADGFSTSNDLDRHKRSCHPGEFATGTFYRCDLGACRNKEKIWPRADNFRAHIRRVHRHSVTEEEMEKLIHRPTQDMLLPDLRPNVGTTLSMAGASNLSQHPPGPQVRQDQGIAGQGDSDSVNKIEASNLQRQLQSASATPSSDDFAIPQRIEGQHQFVTPGDLSHRAVISPNLRLNADTSAETQYRKIGVPDPSESGSDSAASPFSIDGSEKSATSESPDVSIPTAADLSSLVLDLEDPEKLKQILEALQSKGVLKEFGYKKEEIPSTEEKEPESNVQHQDSQIHCPLQSCPKSFSRRCELKKHLKRHEKPYGCTYEGCTKRFGSKNDWKRHENSQHFLLEVWKCDVRGAQNPTEMCGKVSHRRETFRLHLVTNHQLNGDAMEKKLEECRVGRNCEANFWCGFCEGVIKIKSKGVDAWTERYNHIDDHLAGRNDLSKKHMNDWKSVDPESTSHSETSSATEPEPTNDNSASPKFVSRKTLAADTNPKELGRVGSTKRKADGLGDGRSSKRAKSANHLKFVSPG